MTPRMHADELDLPVALVANLLADQFPQWSDLPVRRLASSGTDNAMFRLGDDLVVRMPRIHWASGTVDHEATWLPRVDGHLPVTVPRVLAVGTSARGYPWTWSVMTWVPGVNPVLDRLREPVALARDLAALVRSVRALPLDGGKPKAGPLADRDEQVRRDIVAVADEIDTAEVTAVWEHALATAEWDGRSTWVHCDIAPGNLLLTGDRLTGLIDFAGIGTGDPTLDLGVAWNLLPPPARAVFRSELDVDETTWTRARARALAQALVQLPYYRDTNPVLAANARHVIREVST
ncbi:aminoglycoside phosphotransferase family protein [Cellulomonas fengjieae]|uniref:Aminoglycoside phosphotransferase family protein n=1 Tax=Cellulomonas fengjieae TaxID=2819978 RepID=A0ABS3SJS3_9CELL|nr:aminoglycoside phosphotransferase family protein [Cellulomonas fengjieae]MBO3086003.1 aminoglycoside phosphotransferase family protein [Cellulomonas fengjieae]MBO3103952.1 aminoglycoside phosphotransferase family protein [Cellulomonas fengjieae]QVI65927.1 aminoglycoside phosphotransferase family protein [Cellulomonas fengjieae]